MPQLPQQPDRLHPSETLFHLLPRSLADLVTQVPCGPAVDGTAPPFLVLRHVRRGLPFPQLLHHRGTENPAAFRVELGL